MLGHLKKALLIRIQQDIDRKREQDYLTEDDKLALKREIAACFSDQ